MRKLLMIGLAVLLLAPVAEAQDRSHFCPQFDNQFDLGGTQWLTDGKVYFLASVATVNVTIAATYGGAVVVPSDQGDDPTQYLARLPRAVVSIQ